MLSKKSLKYQMLQVLAYLGDAGVEFLMNQVAKGGKVYLHRKHYTSCYFETLLRELATTGFIERINKNGAEHIRLSSQAGTKIANYIPLPYLQSLKWDGYYRAVAYDFAKELKYKRDWLREQFKSWGMGKYQRSLWITPHPLEEPIDEFLKSQKIDNFAMCFMSKKLSLEEGKEIAKTVWKLSELEENYYKFIDKWKKKLKNKKLILEDKERLNFDYFSLLEKDPHLPEELLFFEWPEEEAKEIFLRVEKYIRKNF